MVLRFVKTKLRISSSCSVVIFYFVKMGVRKYGEFNPKRSMASVIDYFVEA